MKSWAKRFCAAGIPPEKSCGMRIIDCGKVHMARLAVFMSACVKRRGGAAYRNTQNDLFKDWYAFRPISFQNKTNESRKALARALQSGADGADRKPYRKRLSDGIWRG
jgi:glucan phosphorylase